MLLNQGAVEQVIIHYLGEKRHVRVEWHRRAESLWITAEKDFPVVAGVRRLGEDNTSKDMEIIHARYLVACDGAHSWVRHQLGVQSEGKSDGSTWGVLDIAPITDFRAFNTPKQFMYSCISANDSASRHSQKLCNTG